MSPRTAPSLRSWRTRFPLAIAGTLAFASAQSTVRVSNDAFGVEGDQASTSPHVSADGQVVVFLSRAGNLVQPDANGVEVDVLVHDLSTATIARANISSTGVQANDASSVPRVSGDGRFVLFSSRATNLAPGDTNAVTDVFVHDRISGATTRVSVGATGLQLAMASSGTSITHDGRWVAFDTWDSNVTPNEGNSTGDVFVHDRQTGATELVSVALSGNSGDSISESGDFSADGRWVAFRSRATNLVAGDTNSFADIFVRDRLNGVTTRISVGPGGIQANQDSTTPTISADGRFVAFMSQAGNLVPGDSGQSDAFVHDRVTGITERVSVSSQGAQANQMTVTPVVSADGRFVTMATFAANLVPDDTNGAWDVLVHDRWTRRTERASVSTAGQQGNLNSGLFASPSISADGRFVVFGSDATNLVVPNANAMADVYVRDRGPLSSGVDVCSPGLAGVAACPCSNPPSGAGRGCDNSAATGGARLTSSGAPLLSGDTLRFETSGQRPSSASIVVQAAAFAPPGSALGQGVICVGGSLRRMYTQSAVNGSIAVPAAGGIAVSARSAQLGDPIQPGTRRWYAVYYRDPFVLGGCAPGSTSNVTQMHEILWQL